MAVRVLLISLTLGASLSSVLTTRQTSEYSYICKGPSYFEPHTVGQCASTGNYLNMQSQDCVDHCHCRDDGVVSCNSPDEKCLHAETITQFCELDHGPDWACWCSDLHRRDLEGDTVNVISPFSGPLESTSTSTVHATATTLTASTRASQTQEKRLYLPSVSQFPRDTNEPQAPMMCSGNSLTEEDYVGYCKRGNLLYMSGNDCIKHCKCDGSGKLSCSHKDDCATDSQVNDYCKSNAKFHCDCLVEGNAVDSGEVKEDDPINLSSAEYDPVITTKKPATTTSTVSSIWFPHIRDVASSQYTTATGSLGHGDQSTADQAHSKPTSVSWHDSSLTAKGSGVSGLKPSRRHQNHHHQPPRRSEPTSSAGKSTCSSHASLSTLFTVTKT